MMQRYLVQLQKFGNFLKRNPRYVFVGMFSLVAVLFNMTIASHSLKENGVVAVNDEPTSDKQVIWRSDIDGNHLTKIYEDVMNARSGDWHRIGFTAKAFDQDEVLRILVRSEFGREKEVGTIAVPMDGKEHYVDFLVSSDDAYRDVLVRKEKGDSDAKWHGGRVMLAWFSVSRLQVTSDFQAKRLRPTLFGGLDAVDHSLPSAYDSGTVPSLPKGFVFGRIFDVYEDRYLFDVTMRLKHSSSGDVSGKYRLELYEYDSSIKKLVGDAIKKNPFSSKDIKNLSDDNGRLTLDFPVALGRDKTYFIGIVDGNKSGSGNGLQVLDMETGQLSGSAVLRMAKPHILSDGNRFLNNAKLEDFGPFSRYTYSSSQGPSDLMDVYEMSGKINYDEETKAVVGDEATDTSFTYKIDTVRPFTVLRMEASQLGNAKNQIRMEYSYDGSSWTKIDSTQEEKGPQMFDIVLMPNERKQPTIYFRVSYAGGEDDKGAFGLRDFRVTANVTNDNVTR